MRNALLISISLLVGATSASGQTPSIKSQQLRCLEIGTHMVLQAKVDDEVVGSDVRLHFRRLHEVVEDFYWVRMQPKGGGYYWTVLPMPEEEKLVARELAKRVEELEQLEKERQEKIDENTAAWWLVKEHSEHRNPNGDLDDDQIRERASRGKLEQRTWMEKMDAEALEKFLVEQKYEPAEYFAAVYDAYGERISASDVKVVPVTDDCEGNLTAQEQGFAENLIVGETAPWQVGQDVFHWKCDGVITRVDYTGIWRGDDRCRACVIAWWKMKSFLLPVAAGVAATGVVIIGGNEPPRASPSTP